MAVEVERLLVSLEARLTQFERGFDRAAAKSRSTTNQIERDSARMAARVQASFAKAGAVAGASLKAGLAGVAAGALGAISIEGVTKSIADLAKLQDVADRTGVSTKQIQEFSYAVEQSGGEIEDVDKGLQKFAVNLSKAAQGEGDLAKILEANNVALRDQSGALRPVGALLGDVADLVRNATSEQDKLNIATAAFGRGAATGLVLALDGGRKGLAAFAADARKAGLVLGDELVKKAAALDDQIAKTTRQIDGLGKKLIVEFGGPAIAAGLEATLAKLREMNDVIEAIRNADFGKIGAFLMSRTGPGALLGLGAPDTLQSLEQKRRDKQAEIDAARAAPTDVRRQQLMAGAAPLDQMKRDLAEIEDRIGRINATPLKPDYQPSRTGYTAGDATPLDPIDVEGRPTRLPGEAGDALQADAIKAYVDRVFKAESGGNRFAKNPNSSAYGPAQFIDSTFVDQFKKIYTDAYRDILAANDGNVAAARAVVLQYKTNTDVNRKLTEGYAKENADALIAAGQAVTEANLHLAHFLGASGAVAALKASPQASARATLGDDVVDANKAVFRKTGTVQDVLDYADRRANATRIRAGDLTPAEERDKSALESLRESDARTAGLLREAEALNQTAYARAFAAEKARLLADIEKEGAAASAEELAAIDGKAAAYARQSLALDGLERASKAVKDAQAELGEIGADAVKGFVADLKAGKSAADALRGALDRILTRLTDNLIDSLFSGLFGGGGASGGGGIFGSLFAGLFGGARAAGGPVASGKSYLVGEKGPELFSPGRSGAITPNASLARAARAMPVARPQAPRVSPTLRMSIDLRGANGDATIRKIAGQAAATAGREAYKQAVADSDKRVERNQQRRAELGYV